MLSKTEFDILYQLYQNEPGTVLSQRELADKTGASLGKINACYRALYQQGFIGLEQRLTAAGLEALAPYRVENAVIMAAGLSSRFAPLSYERPKALLRVKGEVLIERQIRQLKEAGIRDITVVVGYMKEKMFYLADKLGVHIVVNEDYYRYNNTSTLMRVADRLGNTYLCSSDNYFPENVFEPYVYRQYYAAAYEPGKTDEYCMQCDKAGRIQQVTVGGEDAWYMVGQVYFTREFSQKLVEILRREYDRPETKAELWEDLYIRHIGELELYSRKYEAGKLLEFDSLDDLRKFDESYVENVDSAIFRNICSVLHCTDREIRIICPLKAGMTNISFVFSCRGKQYVYRHPGIGTDTYINRRSEAFAMEAARKLGLDHTYIYMDQEQGWKISYYIENAACLDYHNREQVDRALSMMRRLHGAGIESPFHFDLWASIEKFSQTIREQGRSSFEDYALLYEDAKALFARVGADGCQQVLCHCDCYEPNFLLSEQGEMNLIDWEYAGMADAACDLGTFLACSDYSMEEAKDIIRRYLGHEPTREELRHDLAYVSLISYYWFLWALYQESVGKNIGEYLYIWYRYTKEYGAAARKLYEEAEHEAAK